MKKLAVIYFSGFGHTKVQANAVVKGARIAGVEVENLTISSEGLLSEVAWQHLADADGIIFGAPTYMGNVPWQFKRFADDTSKTWFQMGWKDKIAAGFTNSASMNGDKHGTIGFFQTLAAQHGMLWVSTGMQPSATMAAERNDLNYLGGYAGLLAQSPSDASPEEGPFPGDLLTAEHFGRRVAQQLLRVTAYSQDTPLSTQAAL